MSTLSLMNAAPLDGAGPLVGAGLYYAPAGPFPGTIVDSAATNGWRYMREGDVVTSNAVRAPTGALPVRTLPTPDGAAPLSSLDQVDKLLASWSEAPMSQGERTYAQGLLNSFVTVSATAQGVVGQRRRVTVPPQTAPPPAPAPPPPPAPSVAGAVRLTPDIVLVEPSTLAMPPAPNVAPAQTLPPPPPSSGASKVEVPQPQAVAAVAPAAAPPPAPSAAPAPPAPAAAPTVPSWALPAGLLALLLLLLAVSSSGKEAS